MWSAKERYLPFYHLLYKAGRSLCSGIFCPLCCSVGFFLKNSLKLNTKHHGEKKEKMIILHVPVFSGFNRHMSTGHHSNSKPSVEEKIKILLSLCQM